LLRPNHILLGERIKFICKDSEYNPKVPNLFLSSITLLGVSQNTMSILRWKDLMQVYTIQVIV